MTDNIDNAHQEEPTASSRKKGSFAILIADAGATKIEWAALGNRDAAPIVVRTTGVNAVVCSEDTIAESFQEAAVRLPAAQPGAMIYYYGAGCATRAICGKVASALRDTWPGATVYVESDLVGAARALLGRGEGIACILGTGSNACLCNQGEIRDKITSLGYILGDEGSGAAIGKRLLSDYFKGYMPDILKDRFEEKFHLSLEDVLDRLYRQPAPNRYLASFTPFLKEHEESTYVTALLINEFSAFLSNYVAKFEGARHLPICFTGSIAHHFARQLRTAADSLGLKVGRIESSPMEGLIAYHLPSLYSEKK